MFISCCRLTSFYQRTYIGVASYSTLDHDCIQMLKNIDFFLPFMQQVLKAVGTKLFFFFLCNPFSVFLCDINSLNPWAYITGGRRGQVPQNLEGGIVPPDFVMLQNFKHQITCITMKENVFLPLQQDFYSKSGHAFPPRIPVRSTPMPEPLERTNNDDSIELELVVVASS